MIEALYLNALFILFGWFAWFIYGQPWLVDGDRWGRILTNLWRTRIPAFDEWFAEVEAERQPLQRVKSVVGDAQDFELIDEQIDWWFQRMQDDRFAVREADEVEWANVARFPYRSELWLKYHIGIERYSLRELAEAQGCSLVLTCAFAARFGIVPWFRVGERQLEVIGLPMPLTTPLARRVYRG